MTNPANLQASIVIPCFNEGGSVARTIQHIDAAFESSPGVEVIAVDDGSSDETLEELRKVQHAVKRLRIVRHDRNRGYGAALKTGIRNAKTGLIAIADADGTYPVDELPRLIGIANDHDMVVGARTANDVSYSRLRSIPKYFLRAWIQWIVKAPIPDINSGMRVFRKEMADQFVRILPDSFSFTITITICAMRNNYRVHFEPISYYEREGKSKIKPIRDTLRFLQLIGRTGMYFAPVRILAPMVFILGIGTATSIVYDMIVLNNLTDKTVILISMLFNLGVFTLLADMIDRRSP